MQQVRSRSLIFDRWPRYASRRPWTVMLGVALIIIALIVANAIAGGTYTDNFTLPGTESQEAFDLLAERFEGLGGGDAATVVIKADLGFDALETKAVVAQLVEDFAALPGVAESGVTSPYGVPGSISQEGTIAKFDVNYLATAFEIDITHVEALFDLRDSLEIEGIQVELAGSVATVSGQEPPSSEIIGIIAAVIILLVAFGSVVAMGLPILTALLGLIPGFMIIGLLSRFVDMASFTPQFASMIGIGVGIDYALLIVTRFREGLTSGMSRDDAIVRAMGTAGKAVLFAGSIVVIALFGLWASGLPLIGWVGTAAAVLVATVVIVTLFVLPAALRLIGGKIDTWSVPFIAKKHASNEGGAGTRWAHIIARMPLLWLVLSLGVIGVLASPLFSIRLGSADAGNNPETATTRRAYDLLSEGFGPGFNGPVLVVLDVTDERGIAAVEALPKALKGIDGIAFVAPPFFNSDKNAAIMTVIPTTSPQNELTGETVNRLRAFFPEHLAGTGTQAFVGGLTAVFIDIAQKMTDGLPIFILAVLGVSIILLMLVFRSVIIPLKAALMIAMSVGVGFGVVTAIFQWGWGQSLVGLDSTGPVESFLPMMLFAVLFGLSMDYEVFLVTRIHEEYQQSGDGRQAVERGQAVTFRVIIAAGLIMSSVFFSFALVDERVIKEFGLGLGSAILADALLVRMVLVPSILHLVGNSAWWFPNWLDRALPNLSVKGELHPVPAPSGSSD